MSTGAAGVLAWTGASTLLIAGLSLLGGGTLAQARAATAADLAALAGADALAVAHGDPCGVAAEVASRNDARLTACELREWDVLVTVEVVAAPLPERTARARAGPDPRDQQTVTRP
ncbi:Rv3654c family TadE-like protein [Brachybacterium sp. J144]|uniref:Rv3654c family TadE-like protein n=1 Tax=Brachybacterium sp. J144 TaxID=3116487 RepID=UPI002E78CAB7|nr:Rv3654c family TadE-like protein [Brachybacterium sp. J144]MEE1650886.1 Rv3654c family TadE-like protein [Brachybacterium sp. J144]